MSAAVSLPTQPWTPRPRDLVFAEESIEWWYSMADAALGAHGSGFEPSTTGWDDEAIWRLFEQVFEPRRVRAVRRFYQVAPVMRAIGAKQRERAGWIYRAKPYPVHLRQAWPCDRDSPGVVTLVGAALRSGAVRQAFAKAHGDKPAEAVSQVLDWVSDAIRPKVEKGHATNQMLPKWASEALAEVREWRVQLLTAYAVESHERVRAEYWV